jgi:hypothetical protein
MTFCSITARFRSLNDGYFIRKFKATSRIFRQCTEILCYCLQTSVIPWAFVQLKFFFPLALGLLLLLLLITFAWSIYYYMPQLIF